MGLTVPTLLQQVSVDTDDVSPMSSGVNQRFHRRGFDIRTAKGGPLWEGPGASPPGKV